MRLLQVACGPRVWRKGAQRVVDLLGRRPGIAAGVYLWNAAHSCWRACARGNSAPASLPADSLPALGPSSHRTVCAVPLTDGLQRGASASGGWIVVFSERPSDTEYLGEALLPVASVLGSAIAADRLRKQAALTHKQDSILDRASHALSTAFDLRGICRIAARAGRALVPFESFSVLTTETDGTTSKVIYTSGSADQPLLRLGDRLSVGDPGVPGVLAMLRTHAARSPRPDERPVRGVATISDISAHSEGLFQDAAARGYRSALIAIVRRGKTTRGFLCIASRRAEAFSRRQAVILRRLASHVAAAMENHRLMAEVRETIEALTQAQDHLLRAERLRAFGEMAGGMAHEFNNVLATILGNAHFLLDDIEDEKCRDRLRLVIQAARDGADTLKRLQGFAKDGPPDDTEPLDPNELIGDVIRITQPKWKNEPQKRGIVIELECDLRATRQVSGRGSELREAFVNFVFNAVDAMPDGGRLRLACACDENEVTFTVEDTGTGFTEEALDRAFDPFFTTKGEHGTGLGLSVTYAIITRHGGHVDIDGRPGQGATVTVTLPACTARPAPKAPARAPLPGPPLRTLIVDDDATVSSIFAEVLEDFGHEALRAADGRTALELLSRTPVDVVITDLGMDGMSGWELADAVSERWPRMPVVMVTGWSAEAQADLSKHRNIVAVLPKPVDITELCDALSAAAHVRGPAPASTAVSP